MSAEQVQGWLDYVRSLRCCLCGTDAKPRRAHHIRRFSRTGGTSKKPPDYHAVPLCDICHRGVHNGYGVVWEDVMEAWIPLLIEYFKRAMSTERQF